MERNIVAAAAGPLSRANSGTNGPTEMVAKRRRRRSSPWVRSGLRSNEGRTALSTNRASLMLVEIIVLWLPDGYETQNSNSNRRPSRKQKKKRAF
ncbi:unnamed protein product [Zymoseptoria tritici ST99CH_3D7]|uniref:Uncharacterized protein n=1 Tax=Zymoseptoria tritici (strain ST99CH_3D7) TaxID=1276538 RepID=A0A1X7RST4_ZYMT9|nr:unnamed protein product [Zymoseptoria tritici ST99CH_3D7]